MRQSRTRTALAAGVAGALAFVGAMTSSGLASAADVGPTVANTASEDILSTSDINGCGMRSGWEMCIYFQHGLDSISRVVPDESDQAGRDGSLRVATPGEGDTLHLEHFHGHSRSVGPPLADFDAGGYAVKVLAGKAPTYSVTFHCPAGSAAEGPYEGGMVYAGPYPTAAPGWQTVDVVQGGEAMWWVPGSDTPRPLDEAKATCPTGTVLAHALSQAGPGADAQVDSVRFGSEVTNFWIPPLTRVKGYWRERPAAEDVVVERLRASELARMQFDSGVNYYDGGVDPEWAFPARSRQRLPRARAAVVAAQGSFQSILVAGPLANAVRGPLLVNPSDSLEFETQTALATLAEGRKVYLVGSRKQVSRKVALAIRKQGHQPVRVGGLTPYATAVKVAALIDRRRPVGTRRTIVLASGKRAAHSLSASAAAGASGGAVLLTRGTTMPEVTRTYLANHRPAAVFAVGPEAALAVPGLRRDRQLFGANRYLTAVQVAKRLFPAPPSAVFASGADPVDALLAGAYGGRKRSPLLLIAADSVPRAVVRYLRPHREHLRDSLLVADPRAVSESVFGDLEELVKIR